MTADATDAATAPLAGAEVAVLGERLRAFMAAEVLPAEALYERQVAENGFDASPPAMEELKARARRAGLWNLFRRLSNRDYAPLCEEMGRSPIAPEAFNCSAPDTGNMEVLERFGSEEHRRRWLTPLLAGEIRSAFAMTEPAVASSDATNIAARLERSGNGWRLNGRKWFISGAGHPSCELLICMARSGGDDAPRHGRHSMVVVPRHAPGVKVVRAMTVFGNDHAPGGHMEVAFENVHIPGDDLLLGEGRGFEIAQARLGPGRIHHCARLIGLSERCLELMCRRVQERVAFGRPLARRDTVRAAIADSRMEIDMARMLVLKAAEAMDRAGNKAARFEIAAIKVVAPNLCQRVADRAMQAHGAMGISQDTILAQAWIYARSVRFADGPDEVHRNAIARMELAKHPPDRPAPRERDGR